MSRFRFTTAREVFEAFPTAGEEIEAAPSDDAPSDFAQALLASPTPEDAITFCAYLLPRREAVWWACQCMRSLVPDRASREDVSLQAAEAWVREPEEHHRRAALRIGMQADQKAPTTWVALAAAWSDGGVTEDERDAAPAPPHLTAKAVRAAILTALARVGARERAGRLRACLEAGLRLADGQAPPVRQQRDPTALRPSGTTG